MGEQTSESTWGSHVGSSVASGGAIESRREAAEASPSASPAVRPGPLATLFSFVVWPNWTAGSLLLATLWMPHFTGCNNRPIRPIEMWSEIHNGDDFLGATMFSWPYLWGGLFAVTMIAVALVRPQHPERVLLGSAASVYLLITLAFLISVAVSLFRSLSTASRESDTDWIWAFAPVVMAPGVWAAMAVRRGDLFSAWARLSTGLTCCAVPTIMLLGVFAQDSRYGFNLAMLACGVMVPGCWALRWRGQRALLDRTAPPEKFRFRLMHLVAWVTFIAAVCGYYRFLSLASE